MFKFYRKSIFPLILIFGFAILFYPRAAEINTIDLANTSETGSRSYAIYTKDGDILYGDTIKSIKKILRNTIILKVNDSMIVNPIGVIKNPPNKSIMSIRDKILLSISEGRKVLLIYIDGLGYSLYEKALDEGIIPFISAFDKGEKAITVYPPITDVTFASMVTGETPKYTGIHNRDKKLLMVESVFGIAKRFGKGSKVIEGDIRILTCDVDTVLNIDENKDGFIDDEIYRSALNELKNPTDIFLVHFHSYDDLAHLYGPASMEALDQLSVLDGYTEDIVMNFDGDIIITADHGMHDDGDGGSHGNFCAEDLFIPIITERWPKQ